MMIANAEHCKAADALCGWFTDQRIQPHDAIVIMAMLIGLIMGTTPGERSQLFEGIDLVHEMIKDATLQAFACKDKESENGNA